MKPLRIGITGASGMIGRYLVDNWTNKDLILYSSHNTDAGYPLFKRHSDPDQDELSPFVKLSDVIIHLAHDTSPIKSNFFFPNNFGENIAFTQRLISELQKDKLSKPPLLIYLSSGGTVYGNVKPIIGGITETQTTLPISPYGLEKLTCENLLRLGAMRGCYKLVVLRASNVYGLPLVEDGNQGIIGVGLSRIKAGLPLIITSNPGVIRDYLHLQDLSVAITQVIGAKLAEESYCFNIGSGHGHSIENIIALFKKITQIKIEIEGNQHEYSEYAPNWNVLNSDKLKNFIGWQPIISLETGIDSLWSAL